MSSTAYYDYCYNSYSYYDKEDENSVIQRLENFIIEKA